MARIKPILLSLLFLAILGFFFWAIFSPKNNIQEIISGKLEGEKEKTDISFKIVTFSEIDNGIKYWELNAKSSTINKTTNIADLKSVDGLFFKNGKPTLKFIAPKAKWNLGKKEIRLIEPIGYDIKYEKEINDEIKKLGSIKKFISFFSLPSEKSHSKSKGYWFKAKKLDWKLATKKLYCQGGITLTKGDITIRSKELEADVGLEKLKLTGNPNAVLYSAKDKSKIYIKATSFLVDSQEDIIYANDNVEIKRFPASIYSLNAIYDQRTKVINLSKNVKIKTDKISAWGDKAMYSTTDYIAELTGNAGANRGGNELSGEKIIVLTEEGEIFIIGRSKAKIKESEIEKLQ